MTKSTVDRLGGHGAPLQKKAPVRAHCDDGTALIGDLTERGLVGPLAATQSDNGEIVSVFMYGADDEVLCSFCYAQVSKSARS